MLEREVLDARQSGRIAHPCTYNDDETRIVVKDNTDDRKHLSIRASKTLEEHAW